MGERIVALMMLGLVIGSAYVIILAARLMTRLILPKKTFDDKRIQNRVILVISVFMAALLVILTHREVVKVFMIYL
jgi:hypothetical protein